MGASVIIGEEAGGKPVGIDIEELLATRLLVQGNSGSGKSHLLRRLLEESAGLVQQVVIDPEGDFVTLAEPFGHVVIDGSEHDANGIARLAARIRQHRASVVLALDGLEIEGQMRCAAQFLNTLFDAPREQWFPALVVVDEAQMFAPAAAGDVTDEVRRLSLAAMTNLMCRGRKRGLAGVIATQRLAKLAKNVAAEASNFLMGRTFLDIDMVRAADLLGMERRQAEQIRDLQRGHFLGLGPAISRRPVSVRIGAVRTGAKSAAPALAPLPEASAEDMKAMLFADWSADEHIPAPPRPRRASPADSEALVETIGAFALPDLVSPDEVGLRAVVPAMDTGEREATLRRVLRAMADQPDASFQTNAALLQDFSVRCRMERLGDPGLDPVRFRRLFALALAGMEDAGDERWAALLEHARGVPDDMLAPFLAIGRAAIEGEPCPGDDALGRLYGTHSPGRIRRLLDYMERDGLIVVRTDFGGRRSVGVPGLGLQTAALD
ncbi:MAG: ATP-binding protein [Sphingomonadales bacterium]|nr:ATP-binding protein [Sphingomonadales bacterium]MDE2568544.1 ATP-binding protein [Sphingomonadales bacterium]